MKATAERKLNSRMNAETSPSPLSTKDEEAEPPPSPSPPAVRIQQTESCSERYFLAFGLANVAQGGASLLTPLFIALVLGGGPKDVGLVASLSSLAGVLAGLFWGRLSDRLGRRKPFVLLGFGGLAVGFALLAGVPGLGALLAVHVTLTFLWVAGASVITPLVIEGLPRALWERRIGALNRFGAFGWMAGLILGALWMRLFVESDGAGAMRTLYLVLGGLAALAVALAALWIREPSAHLDRRFKGILPAMALLWERFRFAPVSLFHLLPTPQRLWRVLQGRNGFGVPLTRFFQSVVVYTIGFQAVFVTLPLFLKEGLGLPPSWVFAAFVLHQGVTGLMTPQVARFAERYRTRHLHRAFLGVRALLFLLAGGLILLKDHPALPAALVPFFVLTGISWAFVNVAALAIVAKRVRPGRRSQAIGTYQASHGIGTIIGALLGGLFAEWSYPATFAFASLCVLAGLRMGWRLPPRRRRLSPSEAAAAN